MKISENPGPLPGGNFFFSSFFFFFRWFTFFPPPPKLALGLTVAAFLAKKNHNYLLSGIKGKVVYAAVGIAGVEDNNRAIGLGKKYCHIVDNAIVPKISTVEKKVIC